MRQLESTRFARIARHVSAAGLMLVLLVHCHVESEVHGQDLSWVRGAIERSKQQPRDSVPLWQYDPRVAAGSGDASLHALACASPDRVWAVGDRGLILASQDGGRSWNPQLSGTSLNLYAVAFLDEQHGFAVGGTIQPMSRMSLGIVLITDDAGLHWRSASAEPLARMTGLAIAERGVLRAWGDYSPAHGSAIMESYDQGQTWQPVPWTQGHVQTVARQAGSAQLAIDRAGRVLQVPAKPNQMPSQLAPPTTLIAALMHTGSQWLAVGDNGTLASSRDGAQWIDRPLPLSTIARQNLDLRCIAQVDQHVWSAGSPGSVLLHSEDQGQTWQLQPTDQTWPINAIQFFDAYRGWAVTDAGSILATRDGGKTWFLQRQPLKRLGLQGFASLPGEASWNALAETSWQAKQGTALSVIHRQDVEDAVDFAPDGPAMLSATGVQTGLVTSLQNFAHPLPDRRVLGASSLAQLYAAASSTDTFDIITEMATQLRIGRPTVVLVDDNLMRDRSYLAEAAVQAMKRAQHAEPSDQWLQAELHLPPWQVSRLFTSSRSLKADFTVTGDQLLRDSGLSVSDVLAPVIGADVDRLPSNPLRCLQAGLGGSASHMALFPASDRQADSTRSVDLSNVGNLQLVMGRVHRDKAWQALMITPPESIEELENWKRKLEFVVEASPRHEVGPSLASLAEANFRAGWWERWYAALERLAALPPQNDAARWGGLERLRYGASDERIAWELSIQGQRQQSGGSVRLASSSTWNSTPFENEQPPRTVSDATFISGSSSASSAASVQDVGASAVVAASAEQPSKDSAPAPAQALQLTALRRAVRDYVELVERDKALALRPDVQLANFARRRALAELGGEPAPDALVLQALASNAAFAGWQQVAEQERILASGHATFPAWTARARSTAAPPRLDGLADDACWQNASHIELTSPFHPQAPPGATSAQFAYDAEFLYVMLRCPMLPGRKPPQASRSPRQYDMQLDGTDHVQLALDTDRDYTSACELAVNQAGHTFDRCCQASQWNPKWYVAVQQDTAVWSAELAIKLSDLTTAPTVAGRAWAISVFRYLPDWDVYSWSQLRSYNPRLQGNGLLLFDP